MYTITEIIPTPILPLSFNHFSPPYSNHHNPIHTLPRSPSQANPKFLGTTAPYPLPNKQIPDPSASLSSILHVSGLDYATTSAPLPPPETYLTLGFREEKRPTGGGSHAMGLVSRCSISVRDFLCLLKRASPTHSTPSHLSFSIRILSPPTLLYPAWFCSTSSLCHRARS
ncbi:hypothetical protein XPA_009858 [Xanthoria parietina]